MDDEEEQATGFGRATGSIARQQIKESKAERTSKERIAQLNRDALLQEAREKLAEDRRQFDLDFGLKKNQFGLDILKTGASLRGPENYFQGAAFARGVSDQGLAPFLDALQNGRAPDYGGGTATSGNPVPLTVGTLANDLAGGGGGGAGSGGGGGGGTDAYGRPLLGATDQQRLDAISKTAQNGLANLPLGSLEALTPQELKAFGSGLAYLGRDPESEYEFYKRSRPFAGNPMAA